ncbi:unnamed protein product, partial [Phaeothamnion confervicola]
VVKKSRGEQSVILIPTDANRDLGLFLVFLGFVGTVPVQYFLDWRGLTGPTPFYAALGGIIAVVLGFFFIGFPRKSYVIRGNELAMTDGFLHRTLRYKWEGTPLIRLRSQEEEKGNKDVEYWIVNLVDGKRSYVLDRRMGHQMESRALAEALAKTINCPLVERQDKGEISIPREDLDLPFKERVRRNPNLLGPALPKPEASTAHEVEKDGQLSISWCLAGSAMLNEFLAIAFLLALLALVPIFPAHTGEALQRSFVDLAREEHKFAYFIVAGTVLVGGAFILLGYRKELRATPEALIARDRLWGVPIWGAKIPAAQLEEIWVRQS